MWYIVLSIALSISLGYFAYRHDGCGGVLVAWVFPSVGSFAFLCVLGIPVLGFTTGLGEGYSSGFREGYITKISNKGVVYKTTEAQMQIGTGELAALQSPWEFSISDQQLAAEIEELQGRRVRVDYEEWIIQPFRAGGTSYRATAVTLLEGATQ